jgi:hypothetical protein
VDAPRPLELSSLPNICHKAPYGRRIRPGDELKKAYSVFTLVKRKFKSVEFLDDFSFNCGYHDILESNENQPRTLVYPVH